MLSRKNNSYIERTLHDGKSTIGTRQVQFSNKTQVFHVSGLWEISHEEIDATWLTEEDSTEIQRNILKIIKRMRRGIFIDEEKYCTRGLQHMRTASELEKRKTNKASVLNAVLNEQSAQRNLGIHDPVKICNKSMAHSKQSRDDALRLGASDAAAKA